jgi:hypothetical protein
MWLTAVPARVAAQQPALDRSPLECAEFMAAKLEADSMERSMALVTITGKYWKLGHPKEALRASATQPADQQSSFGLYYVDQALKRSDRKFADQLLQQLISSDTERDQQFRMLYIRRLLQLDHLAQAEELAREGNADEWSYPEGLLEIAGAYLQTKKLERTRALLNLASAAIDPTPGSESACSNLSQIIPLFAAVGQPDRAEAALQQGLLLADTIHHNPMSSQSSFYEEGDKCRGSLADAMAQIGRFDQAQGLADALDPLNRVRARIDIANEYRRTGAATKASELLARSVDDLNQLEGYQFQKSQLRLRIIRTFLDLNDDRSAARVVGGIEPDNYLPDRQYLRDTALLVADRIAQGGRSNEAAAVLNGAVKSLVKLKPPDPGEVGTTVERSFVSRKALRLGEFADGLLELGEYAAARRAIDGIELPHFRVGKMADLARMLLIRDRQNAEARKVLDAALRLSESSTNFRPDDPPDSALANVAAVYAQLGERDVARGLFLRVVNGKRLWERYGDPLTQLAEIGYYFELSRLPVDRQVAAALRAIDREYSNRNLVGYPF